MTHPDGSSDGLSELAAILAEGFLRLQRITSQDQKVCDDMPNLSSSSEIIQLDSLRPQAHGWNSTVNSNSPTERSSNA